MFKIEDCDSSLIQEVSYDREEQMLVIKFRDYYVLQFAYCDVPIKVFSDFITSKSLGKYYLRYIKNKFKTLKDSTMAERPKTTNKSSDQKRFIKISIDVTKIKKDWLFQGEKGTYLNITLGMLPDGETDNYGNLGMITQDVPKEVFSKDRAAKGPILGNAAEFEPKPAVFEGQPGQEAGKMMSDDSMDDLPF